MKKILFAFIFFSLNIYASPIHIKGIDKLLRQEAHDINFGIKIRNLKSGKVVYEKNADYYYNFASAVKLITSAASYNFFGTDHDFQASLTQDHGNLYLDVSNFPSFSTENLDQMMHDAKKKIGSKILNFYIVDKPFSLPEHNPQKMIYDSMYCYGAKLTSSHINKNCYHLTAKASNNLDDKAVLNSKYDIYNIINNTKTIQNDQHAKIIRKISKQDIIVDGTLNSNYGEILISPVVEDNISNLSLFIKNSLQQNKIKLEGKILVTNESKGERISKASAKLSDILSDILKNSDNFMSDYLLAIFTRQDGFTEWEFASKKMLDYISEVLKIDFHGAKLVDASGLSRLNRFTPNQFDALLSAIYKHQGFIKFMDFFARPSENGTLNTRFENINLIAKTGSMTSISSIVGYVFDKKNVPYSFVIVSNNFQLNSYEIKNIEERILKIIANSQK